MKKILFKLELLLIISPILVVFSIIFNFHDTKYLVSRFLIVVSLYCLFRFRSEISLEFKKKRIIFFLGSFSCVYFFFMQYLNEGNSDLPRSMLYILVYFIVLPSRFLNSIMVFLISSVGCISSGFLALYESYVLGMGRIGYLTINPIPYAFYSGLSLIILVGTYKLLLNHKYKKILSIVFVLSLFFGIFATIHSQTRATYLALIVIGFFWIASFFVLHPSKKNLLISILLLILVPSMLWNLSDVRLRTLDALHQIQNFSQNDYSSSSGARVMLWKAGVTISKGRVLLGHSKSEISEHTQELIELGNIPDYIGQYLIHPNPNFHNQFVQTLVDSGLIGLIFMLLFLLAPILLLGRCDNRKLKWLSNSVVGYTVICFWFDSMFLYNHTFILYGLSSILIFFMILNSRFGEEVV